MISRYSRPEMANLFSDQAKVDRWLAVEQAVLVALADAGIAPRTAADALTALPAVDVAAVQAREAEIHHDLAAFVDVAAAAAPGAAGWIHYGLTSSDVVDTALALQLRGAGTLVLAGIDGLRSAVLRRAHELRDAVTLGRTHGMPAEVTTFGAKLAGWWHQLGRDHQRIATAVAEVSAGKLSGAVGTYSGVTPEVEATVLGALGLDVDPSATQVVQRDRHAALLGAMAIHAATLERIALEVRHLQRPEVGEAAEPFARSQKGSSAMPHKRNPIVAEQVCGLARVVRANAGVSLENIALWHERDISHSSTERIIFEDSLVLVDYLLAKVTWLVAGLDVDAERMRANVLAQGGLVTSQRVLLALVGTGMVRDEAYRIVQEAAAAVRDGAAPDLRTAVLADTTADAAIAQAKRDDLFDATRVPAGLDHIFGRLPAAD
jgi:adenylosuccinate lyase